MNTLPATVATNLPAPTPSSFYAFPKTENKFVVPFAEDAVRKELGEAIAEYDKHAGHAIRAAIRIGHAALTAKDLIQDGKFTKWLETNFPAFSVQWARNCMRAATAYNLLEEKVGYDKCASIVEDMGSVEKMAALVGIIKGVPVGESPLSAIEAATKPSGAKVGRPAKTAAPAAPKAAKVLEGDQQHRSAAELMEWEDDLTERESQLAARIEALEAREQAVAERERKLTLAATVGDSPAAVVEQAGSAVADAERPAWPFTPAQLAAGKADATTVEPKKAPATSGKPRGSRAKAKGNGSPAPKAENGSEDDRAM